MIKELFLAIILGAILGFGVTGGFITFKRSQESTSKQQIKQTEQTNPATTQISNTPETIPTSSQKQTSNENIIIDSPEDGSIVNNAKVDIQGSTSANNLVIVHTPIKTYNTNADNEGNFKISVDLESGANSVEISSVNPETDETFETNLLITYSTAKI